MEYTVQKKKPLRLGYNSMEKARQISVGPFFLIVFLECLSILKLNHPRIVVWLYLATAQISWHA